MNPLNKILILTAAVVLSGCYTVLMHQSSTLPVDEEMTDEGDAAQKENVSYESECYSCHTNEFQAYDYAWYGHTYVAYDDSRWNYYYANDVPWWIGSWTTNDSVAGEQNDETQTSRNYGRRRTAINVNNTSGSLFNNGTSSISAGSGGSSSNGSFVYPNTSVTKDSTTSVKTDSAAKSENTKSTKDNKKRNYGTRKTAKKKE